MQTSKSFKSDGITQGTPNATLIQTPLACRVPSGLVEVVPLTKLRHFRQSGLRHAQAASAYPEHLPSPPQHEPARHIRALAAPLVNTKHSHRLGPGVRHAHAQQALPPFRRQLECALHTRVLDAPLVNTRRSQQSGHSVPPALAAHTRQA